MAEEKTLRERWIAALRSGEYVQGKAARKKHGRFCCLGVLCDIADPGAWIEASYGSDIQEWNGGFPYSPMEEGAHFHAVIAMNDTGNKTFAEIADYIEAHPEIDPQWPPKEAT